MHLLLAVIPVFGYPPAIIQGVSSYDPIYSDHAAITSPTIPLNMAPEPPIPPPAPMPPAVPTVPNLVPIYEYFNGENYSFSTQDNLAGSHWTLIKKAYCLSSFPGENLTSLQYWQLLKTYRAYKGGPAFNNFYTINKNELSSGGDPPLASVDRTGRGYRFRGILGYVSTVQRAGMVPLYRSFKGAAGGVHYYTIIKADQTTGQRSVAPFDNGNYGAEENQGFVWPPEFC